MAMDVTHRIGSGAVFYTSLLWDELQWLKIFKPWWGNKFVFQTGWRQALLLKGHPFILSLDFSLSRPWTYTHKYPINTYSHFNYPLGFPYGPSAIFYAVKMEGWLSLHHFISLQGGYLKKGTGLGTSVLDNYEDRNPALDKDTPVILGRERHGFVLNLNGIYEFNSLWELHYTYRINRTLNMDEGYLSVVFSW